MDNFKGHHGDAVKESFKSMGTKYVFLPPHTTSFLQPLDVGILGPYKKKLETKFFRELVLKNINTEQLDSTPKVTMSKQRLDALKLYCSVWDEMTADTICSAWRKARIFE